VIVSSNNRTTCIDVVDNVAGYVVRVNIMHKGKYQKDINLYQLYLDASANIQSANENLSVASIIKDIVNKKVRINNEVIEPKSLHLDDLRTTQKLYALRKFNIKINNEKFCTDLIQKFKLDYTVMQRGYLLCGASGEDFKMRDWYEHVKDCVCRVNFSDEYDDEVSDEVSDDEEDSEEVSDDEEDSEEVSDDDDSQSFSHLEEDNTDDEEVSEEDSDDSYSHWG
jgi:hypothetical protein